MKLSNFQDITFSLTGSESNIGNRNLSSEYSKSHDHASYPEVQVERTEEQKRGWGK